MWRFNFPEDSYNQAANEFDIVIDLTGRVDRQQQMKAKDGKERALKMKKICDVKMPAMLRMK